VSAPVRRATAVDAPAVRDIRLRALATDPDAFDSTYERELARPVPAWPAWVARGATFVLDADDGALAGIAVGMADHDEPGTAYLLAVWVDPARRGTGAADALVSAVVAWADEHDVVVLRLHVVSANTGARRVYERHGFRATGRLAWRARDGAEELEMERRRPPA
jgi:ribosomal protein S18 acetylase RimI-like enzyme